MIISICLFVAGCAGGFIFGLVAGIAATVAREESKK